MKYFSCSVLKLLEAVAPTELLPTSIGVTWLKVEVEVVETASEANLTQPNITLNLIM